MNASLELGTTWGVIRVCARDGALLRCELPAAGATHAGLPRLTRCRLHAAIPADRRVLARAEKFVRACLGGRRPPVVPPLAPASPGAWSRRVLVELQKLPRGATATYGEIARRLGRPRAARAVGRACGANPLPLFIPCHRVVAAGGALGGFSAGLAWKKLLLAKERA